MNSAKLARIPCSKAESWPTVVAREFNCLRSPAPQSFDRDLIEPSQCPTASAIALPERDQRVRAGMNVYLICPVRQRNASDQRFADDYVAALEARGVRVHYPPRDVDQTDDGIGLAISTAHREAMLGCDEVHVIWSADSVGSHFDLGMAFMLRAWKPTRIVVARPYERTPGKSYGNKLAAIAEHDQQAR
jgi:hypothetical protein